MNKPENEIWHPIEGFPGYEVSSIGRVRSPRRVLKQMVTKGYPYVSLYRDGRHKRASVHRLVGKAFVPGFAHGLQINHLDGVKSNNALSNLEWCTPGENQLHAFRTGLKSNAPKLPDDVCLSAVIEYMKGGVTQTALANKYGVDRGYIFDLVHGRRRPHIKVKAAIQLEVEG